jgi:adenosylcobinamide kinase / adenosylcobinamide-phosphate guanylyltransferase
MRSSGASEPRRESTSDVAGIPNVGVVLVTFVLVLGGARSGKSTVACRIAQQSGADVTFIATARPLDDEMRARIAAHLDDRPASWVTVEVPLELSESVAGVDSTHAIIVDCVTVWISNLIVERGLSHDEVLDRVDDLIQACLRRDAPTVVVSNEVGMGVVPDTELGRSFRDLQGFVNSRLAASAERAGLVVAGRILDLGTQETWAVS